MRIKVVFLDINFIGFTIQLRLQRTSNAITLDCTFSEVINREYARTRYIYAATG